MKILHWPLATAVATSAMFAFAIPVSASDVTGKTTFVGKPPKETVIDMTADARCTALHSTPISTRHYVVGPDGGLADVFVYIKSGLELKNMSTPPGLPTLDQLGCEYTPYVMGVQVSQKLGLKNSDSLLHTVHIFSQFNGEQHFAQTEKDQVYARQFDKPEVFMKIKCDVHPWMLAYVGVVESPFYAVTRKDGTFTLKGVPPGKYVIAAVHPKAGTQTRAIEVKDDQDVAATFAFEAKGAR
ncbi:MAG: carboxypeptidase regulatory-like domain-containing protein [Limisphaerales bacterium]